MYINQITYVTAISLRELESKVEEEMLTRAKDGHVFFTALPLVPKQSMNTLWVQPLVFGYDTEGGDPVGTEYEEVEEATPKVGIGSGDVITFPWFDDEYFENLRIMTRQDYVKIGEDE